MTCYFIGLQIKMHRPLLNHARSHQWKLKCKQEDNVQLNCYKVIATPHFYMAVITEHELKQTGFSHKVYT